MTDIYPTTAQFDEAAIARAVRKFCPEGGPQLERLIVVGWSGDRFSDVFYCIEVYVFEGRLAVYQQNYSRELLFKLAVDGAIDQ